MINSVNSVNGLSRPVGAGKAVAGEDPKANAGISSSEPIVQISGGAATLSSLYEAASAFVQKSSMKPLTGSNGDDPRSWYLNVEKYNDHIFDQAALSVAGEAHKVGVNLSKDDVVKQLKESNAEISSYKLDIHDRNSKIHPDSVYKYLSKSELDNITDIYIQAKANGLPDLVGEVYAINLGDTNKMRSLGIKYYSGSEYIINDAAAPPEDISHSIAEDAKKLYGHFGMSNMAINALAASYTAPGRQQVFQLLLQMLEADSSLKVSA